jgi:hypothetical protein
MSADYSISLNGILTAERNLSQAAQRIATVNLPSAGAPADSLSLTDLAAELVAVDRAKITAEANLRVLSTQQGLEREALDLFA